MTIHHSLPELDCPYCLASFHVPSVYAAHVANRHLDRSITHNTTTQGKDPVMASTATAPPPTTPPPPVVSGETEWAQINTSKIALHPRNPRRDVGDVTELAASITETGILQDLVLAPWPTDLEEPAPAGTDFVLLAGHRRLAGARLAGLTTVPVKIRHDLNTTIAQLEAMLVENLHRADLTAIEEADTYQAILDLDGLTQTALAKAVGQPKSRVSERLKLARLAQAVKDKVHSGQVSITDALILDEFRDDEALTESLTDALGSSNFTFTANRARETRKAEADLAARVKALTAAGVKQWTREELEALGATAWTHLSNIDHSIYSYSDSTTVRDVKVARAHGSCPGHGFQLTGLAWDPLSYVCTASAEHESDDATAMGSGPGHTTPAVSAEEQERLAKREQMETDLAAAAVTRRDHLREVLTTWPRTGLEGLAQSRLISTLIDEEGDFCVTRDPDAWATVSALAGLKPGDPAEDADYGEKMLVRAAVLRPVLERMTLAQVAVLVDIAMHLYVEDELSRTDWKGGASSWGEPGPVEWVAALTIFYGYELSDFEQTLLTPAETDVDDEGGDDE